MKDAAPMAHSHSLPVTEHSANNGAHMTHEASSNLSWHLWNSTAHMATSTAMSMNGSISTGIAMRFSIEHTVHATATGMM